MYPDVPETLEDLIDTRLRTIERRLDAVDRIIEIEYALVARLSEGTTSPATSRAARSAMNLLVTASTYRSLLELQRERLETLVELE